MAVVYMDGFEFYESTAEMATHHPSDYLNWLAGGDVSLVPGRVDASKAAGIGPGGSLVALFRDDTAHTSGSRNILGAALRVGSGAQFSLTWCLDDKAQMSLVFAPDRTASILAGGAVIATHAEAFTPDVWFYCEAKWAMAVHTGALVCRIKEVLPLQGTTGLLNMPAGRGVNRLVMSSTGSASAVDDFVIYDQVPGAGFSLNTFEGDLMVATLPSPSRNSFVDGLLAGGQYFDFLTEGMDPAAAIYAVASIGGYRNSGFGPDTLATAFTQRLRLGDAVAVGPRRPIQGRDTALYADVFPVDPSTNAPWTPQALVPTRAAPGFSREA